MRRGSSPISKLRAHTVSIFTRAPKTLHSSRKPPAGQPNVGTTHAHARGCSGTDGHKTGGALCESRRAEGMHVDDRARAATTRSERGWAARRVPGASLDRPWLRRDRRTQIHDRPRGPPVDLADQLKPHRTVAQAQPESRRARSDQRRFQALSRWWRERAENRL